MELKLSEKIKAAVELNGAIIINMENSAVYESVEIEKNEAFIYIKSTSEEGKEIKIRFLKTQ